MSRPLHSQLSNSLALDALHISKAVNALIYAPGNSGTVGALRDCPFVD
jgi:hypothetical protein